MSETGRGGMPRIAEPLIWNPDRAMSARGEWGCPKCGNEDSRVQEVDRDADFIRVRLRVCTRCETKWSTEERRMDGPEAFFARAEGRRWRSFTKHRYATRRCLVCLERYMAGKYMEHTQSNEKHVAKVALKAKRRAETLRKYRREHARRTREVRREAKGTLVCKRCGERYDASVVWPYRTHAGTNSVHARVLREEAAARKDRRKQAAKRGTHAA